MRHVMQLVAGKAHSYTTSVKLIHIQIYSVRLTHSSATDVKLIHIYTSITTVRLTQLHYECEWSSFTFNLQVRLSHFSYNCEAHWILPYLCDFSATLCT